MIPDVFWIQRPTACRHNECSNESLWVALYDLPPDTRVEGICDDHALPRWKANKNDITAKELLAIKIGRPQTCTLRKRGELCGNKEDCAAIYIMMQPDEMFRIGPACSQCLENSGYVMRPGMTILPPIENRDPRHILEETIFSKPAFQDLKKEKDN